MSDKKLPKGWKIVISSEIMDIRDGTHDTPKYVTENGIPLITSKNLKGNDIDFTKISFISEEDHFEISKRSKVENGDILFAMIGTIGNPAIIKGDANFSIKNVGLFKKNEAKILPEFFVNFLRSSFFGKQLSERKLLKGTTQRFIPLGNLRKIEIPLPPLETQQAIVSKIEELFSELDKGIEDIKTAQQQLKTYRQSVLNLLATNENLMPIEKLIDKLDQGWSPKCENQASVDKNQWAVIKTSAIQQGYFVEIENKILPTNLSPKEQHEIQSGDILITRAGPRVRVGICCMVRHTRPKLINCDKVYRIKVNKKIVIPEYFEYIINTPKYQDIIEKMKSGISDSGLNLTQKVFVQIEIPVPTIEEQHHVVQEIESRLSVADKMEESIAHSLLQAESLRQSILKKAFSGELV